MRSSSQPRKILLLIQTSETGGAETVFKELATRLDRRRFAPEVAMLGRGWLCDQMSERGLNPIVIPSKRGAFDQRLFRGIRRAVRETGAELVHSHLFMTNVYASAACVATGVPVVSTFHGTIDVPGYDRSKSLKWGIINRLSRRTVFVSEFLRDHFVGLGYARRSKAVVIPNGIDVDRFRSGVGRVAARARLGLEEGDFVIGCVGDVRPSKDYLTALRAASILRDRIPRLRMLIAGSPTDLMKSLLAERASLGLESIVEFLGFRPDIENVLPAFDVYLSSSSSEGFSLTLVEALASSLPVVATRSGGPEEIIRDGVSGLLVEVGSPDAVAMAVLQVYDDRPLANSLASAGAQCIASRYSVNAMVKSYEDLYESVLTRNDTGA